MTPAARPTCEARVAMDPRPDGWGFAPRYCGQSVGLRSFQDAMGHVRRHCAADGHRTDVERRFGVLPYSDLGDGWSESELRFAAGDR